MTRPGLSCEERQVKCQSFLRWLIFAAFAYTTASWSWSFWAFTTGGNRATVSENAAALAQRDADKTQGRVEAIPANFTAINALLMKIQGDLDIVKIAVARLESQSGHNVGSTNRPALK